MDTVPAYVDWRACTAILLSGLADFKVRPKLPLLSVSICRVVQKLSEISGPVSLPPIVLLNRISILKKTHIRGLRNSKNETVAAWKKLFN